MFICLTMFLNIFASRINIKNYWLTEIGTGYLFKKDGDHSWVCLLYGYNGSYYMAQRWWECFHMTVDWLVGASIDVLCIYDHGSVCTAAYICPAECIVSWISAQRVQSKAEIFGPRIVLEIWNTVGTGAVLILTQSQQTFQSLLLYHRCTYNKWPCVNKLVVASFSGAWEKNQRRAPGIHCSHMHSSWGTWKVLWY